MKAIGPLRSTFGPDERGGKPGDAEVKAGRATDGRRRPMVLVLERLEEDGEAVVADARADEAENRTGDGDVPAVEHGFGEDACRKWHFVGAVVVIRASLTAAVCPCAATATE